jgi:hypothetical protein
MKLMPRSLFNISAGGMAGSVIWALLQEGNGWTPSGLAIAAVWFFLWIAASSMDWSRPVWDDSENEVKA